MTAPTPLYGANPYTLAYQSRQFDVQDDYRSTGQTVLDALVNPPAAGIAAEASPSIVFAENTNPTVGADDDEPDDDYTPGTVDSETMVDPLYPEETQ